MSRYINADALRNAMYHEAFETDTEMQRWDSGCWIRYKLFENVLDQQPTVDVPQWIPCSERLPEGDEIVLVNALPIAPYQIILATAKDVRKYYTEGAVDAWMPLPEPWKGEAE